MTVEILFSKAFMFGDEANATYLRRCLPRAEFVYTDLLDKPYFADNKPDLIYMGATSEHNQKRAIAALLPYRNRLAELMDDGVHMLFTGNSIDILGESVTLKDIDGIHANRWKCLGLFPFRVEGDMAKRYYSPILAKSDNTEIVGFKSQFGHMYDLPERYAWMQIKRGDGIHPGVSFDGIHKNNLFATYLIGPLLVLNPLFTKQLLRALGEPDNLPFEETVKKAYEIRLAEFHDTKRKIEH